MKRIKVQPKIFLEAAILQFNRASGSSAGSRASCVNVSTASANMGFKNGPELAFYSQHFMPKEKEYEFFWWPYNADNTFDHESRIYALLFAYEIAKSLRK